MGKYRRIPTISGHEGSYDKLFLADMLPDGDPGTVDLHGFTADEARRELDRFLDGALAEGIEVVKIVHGKGQGTLAMLVREVLNKDKRVRYSRPSTNQMGAAVVAELDSG